MAQVLVGPPEMIGSRTTASVAIAIAAAVVLTPGCRAGPDPAQPGRWHLVEEWRVGTTEQGPAEFGQINSILVDRRGQLWVIDRGAQDIRVFDSTGRFVRTVGRRGSGPGEFVGATGMIQGTDGTIWVQDPQNVRLSGFDQDGRFTVQVSAPSMGYGYSSTGGVDSTGRIWEDFMGLDSTGHPTWRYRRFEPGMARADTVDLATCGIPPNHAEPRVLEGRGGGATIPYQPIATTARDFNGRLACVPWTAQYSGVILGLLKGDTLGRFHHTAAMIPVRPAERDSEVAQLTAFSKKIGAEFAPSTVPTEQPPIVRLHFDDGGRLWVQRITADGRTEFDRFDRDGRLEATITTAVSPGYPAPVFRGDRVYFMVEGLEGVPQVVRLRIDRMESSSGTAPKKP